MSTALSQLMQTLIWRGVGPVGESAWHPPADVYRTRNGWLVKLDVAGIRPEEVCVLRQDSHLIIKGVRRDCTRHVGSNHYRMEIAYSCFERTIDIPCDLESAVLAIEYHDGMLLVQIDTEKKS